MEKTAVEWFWNQIENSKPNLNWYKILEQALEMEKQQIIDAVQSYAPEWIDAEKYFQETFKK
jgi:hypothetical protein